MHTNEVYNNAKRINKDWVKNKTNIVRISIMAWIEVNFHDIRIYKKIQDLHYYCTRGVRPTIFSNFE
jgi:uncharacterized PurR-regulated membrane protein YhhQ (DUF165 family)